jgi:hypothetical protein
MSYGNPLIAGIVTAVASATSAVANATARGKEAKAHEQSALYSLAATNRHSDAAQTVAAYEYQTALLNMQAEAQAGKTGLAQSKGTQQLVFTMVAVGIVAGTVTLIALSRRNT